MSNFLVGTNLADVQLDKFNGDTTTVAFTLSVASSTFSALVRISGVVQTPTDDFSIVNSTLTFTTAPPTGTDNIVVTYTKATQIGVPNDASVSASKLASNAVTTAKILDANVTLAKMASGTDGNIISYDASGNPVAIATGTDGQVLTSAGAGAQPAFEDVAAGGFTLGTEQATTSGTTVTFSSIPSGTTVIKIMIEDLSLSGTDDLLIQIGDSGGIETTGYVSLGAYVPAGTPQIVTSTAGFVSQQTTSSQINNGMIELQLKDAANFTWTSSHNLTDSSREEAFCGSGVKSLSAELTQLRLATTGSDTFTAGSVNISYI